MSLSDQKLQQDVAASSGDGRAGPAISGPIADRSQTTAADGTDTGSQTQHGGFLQADGNETGAQKTDPLQTNDAWAQSAARTVPPPPPPHDPSTSQELKSISQMLISLEQRMAQVERTNASQTSAPHAEKPYPSDQHSSSRDVWHGPKSSPTAEWQSYTADYSGQQFADGYYDYDHYGDHQQWQKSSEWPNPRQQAWLGPEPQSRNLG
jgi:hypothetical protein